MTPTTAIEIARLIPPRRSDVLTALSRLWSRLLAVPRRLVCHLRGHEMVLHFEPDRLSLFCLRCSTRTPGWTLDVRPQFRTTTATHARADRGERNAPRLVSSRRLTA